MKWSNVFLVYIVSCLPAAEEDNQAAEEGNLAACNPGTGCRAEGAPGPWATSHPSIVLQARWGP